MAIPGKMKEEVYERDGYRCQRCGTKKHPYNLNAHHIQPEKDGGKTDPENLVTLCQECHERSHRYNEDMAEDMSIQIPDRGLAAFTFPNTYHNDYVSDLDEHLNESGPCIPIHIREALYAVISVEGEERSQAVNCWRVDLQPEQKDTFGLCDCPSSDVCLHLVEAHLIDPRRVTESGDWNDHAVDPGMGTCWAPLCISDFLEEVPRHPKLPFESRLRKFAEPLL